MNRGEVFLWVVGVGVVYFFVCLAIAAFATDHQLEQKWLKRSMIGMFLMIFAAFVGALFSVIGNIFAGLS